MRYFTSFVCLLSLCLSVPRSALATYSIIACDQKTGECGAAVATNNLAVGASVCHAVYGVGALVSQFETHPDHGPEGLRLLSERVRVDSTLARLLQNDNNFEGLGIEFRQIALVNAQGQTANHSGEHVLASAWAGVRSGAHYSVQGNGLAGEYVLIAMEEAFLKADGSLAERLLSALIAGQTSGGQRTGSMSAALLVRTQEGWPHDIDLRVDASKTPVQELAQMVHFHYARQSIIRAERFARAGSTDKAWNSVAEALQKGASWDRIWRRSARLAISLDEPERALEYLAVFMALNPTWAHEEISQDRYSVLEEFPLFQSWILEDR